ncbi:MAG TPA: mycofactocin precursor MftA [Acidimicrobiales bacterium]|nr:mycofactocin precursor MftA [Acidimicrobiales bacterium]
MADDAALTITDATEADTPDTPTVDDEVLVEEISIDGMCGVY